MQFGQASVSLTIDDIDTEDHINLADHAQFEAWANRLGITGQRLRELVARVGPRARDVMTELNRPDSLD